MGNFCGAPAPKKDIFYLEAASWNIKKLMEATADPVARKEAGEFRDELHRYIDGLNHE